MRAITLSGAGWLLSSAAQGTPCIEWCTVVWFGLLWYGVAWCVVLWHGIAWCGVVWRGVAQCGVVWCVEGAVAKSQWPRWFCTRKNARRAMCLTKRCV